MRVFKVNLRSPSPAYAECGKTIQRGGLVAFPTETVYGLGANGLNKEALIALFRAKKRPANDPVILHVSTAMDSFRLWNITKGETEVIRTLQQRFWPGPCTIVARQSHLVPDEATAASGFASCRMPSHPVAQRLIESAKCPLAAPSANLFGRITPTQASHVKKYFSDTDIDLLECDECCGFGIESTVLRVCEKQEGKVSIEILRHGAISENELIECLRPLGDSVAVESRKDLKVAVEGEACESPGQLLRHYAPTTKTCLLVHNAIPGSKGLPRGVLSSAILIDVLGEFDHLRSEASGYRILSVKKDPEEISYLLFKTLHEAEADAERLRNDDTDPLILLGINDKLMGGSIDKLKGVYDRMFRAATGQIVYIQ